jgi:DNA invertase Pin-like site-specific DNA recombinase
MFINSQIPYKKAIAYYRHSAEDKQENSIAIQREHTQKFAREHHIDIIHEETDEGKSGLLASRPGFENLFINWVENPEALVFDYILVYDVSRWGRFQDQDQAGHYTFLCRKYGKEVIYVSRGFPDPANQLVSSLEISIHRYMAAEYSRQLSDKVFHGSVKVSKQGYSAGGNPVYGMARQLLDVNKNPVRILETGEHKQIANERVSFTPKNDVTTETVRNIFHWFVDEKYSLSKIAERLNSEGILSPSGKFWDQSKIIRILTNETYIGTRIYNKTRKRLKRKSYKNPRSEWVIVPNAFKGIVDEAVFNKAQERIYWIFSYNWRKGINTVKKAKKNIDTDILKWLLSKGLTDFEAYKVILELPVVYSVKVENMNASNWCFWISEKMRNYDHILAVSATFNSRQLIDEFFLFSVKEFTQTNFLIFFEGSELYQRSRIIDYEIEESIKLLINQFKIFKQKCGYYRTFFNKI